MIQPLKSRSTARFSVGPGGLPPRKFLTSSSLYAHVIQAEDDAMRSSSTPIISVRVSPNERAMLETAAAQAHTNISDFVRRKAIEAAEMEVLDHRLVTIPTEDWDKFEDWVNSPVRDIPALRKLSATRPAWRD